MLRSPVLSIVSLAALLGNAEARNIFSDFTKAPTFDPPPDSVPTEIHYGVMAQCEIKLFDGRVFWASMNTSVGWFKKRTPEDAKEFVRDHVAEAKAWWRDVYPKSTFTSEESPIEPKGAPPSGIECFHYRVQVDGVQDSEQPNVLLNTRMEGLTCA